MRYFVVRRWVNVGTGSKKLNGRVYVQAPDEREARRVGKQKLGRSPAAAEATRIESREVSQEEFRQAQPAAPVTKKWWEDSALWERAEAARDADWVALRERNHARYLRTLAQKGAES